MVESTRRWLLEVGLSEPLANTVVQIGAILIVLVIAGLAYLVVRKFLLRAVRRMISRSRTNWDDILLSEGVFNRLCKLVPAIVIHFLVPVALLDHPGAIRITQNVLAVYLLVMGLLVIDAILNGALSIYRGYAVSRRIHLHGLVQVGKIVLYFVGGILILSTVLDRSPIVFFSGLGALTAVLMFIFKDAILGFVAGVQLTSNNMVLVGDWIAMPAYGADGNVLEVSLTTVKVQNWDKTITTIPTYALISESFKNWRGMEESGGRRIKRSISIDMTSVKICDDAMLERFKKFAYISEYVETKKREVADWNEKSGVDGSELINGRRLSNLGTFRAYIEAYLRNHPLIYRDMTFLVRHLQPTEKGLPIEIYVFSTDQRWVQYEAIQADIFDHIVAVVPEFELRVFQLPTGLDVARLGLRAESSPGRDSSVSTG